MNNTIPNGYCQCGCGQRTGVYIQSSTKDGFKKGEHKRFISGHNNGKKEKALGWKGGKTKTSHGYVCLHMPDHPRALKSGYVYEHIIVAEQIIGRSVTSQEVVHHINGNKSDNSVLNLIVCKNQKEHFMIHQRQRALAECGNPNLRQCTFCKAWDKQENLSRLHGSAYHKECARLESKKRYDAGLSVRDPEKVKEYRRKFYDNNKERILAEKRIKKSNATVLALLLVILGGCKTINVNNYGDGNYITIEQPQTVATSPTLDASGNTVPLSAVP